MRQKIIKNNKENSSESFKDSGSLLLINKFLHENSLKKDFYEVVKPLLREFLHKVLVVEHTTIPVYLTALYSIKDGANIVSSQIIRSVVVEEMLHMILVCNVMNTLGLKPTVNTKDDYPTFPCKLPLKDSVFVNLEGYSYNCIANFVAIEKPNFNEVENPVSNELKEMFGADDLTVIVYGAFKEIIELNDNNKDLIKFKYLNVVKSMVDLLRSWLDGADTIGKMYDRILKVISFIHGLVGDVMFCGDPKLQILPEHYYGSGGSLISIHSIDDIEQAFDEIKDQGEGAYHDGIGSMYDKDASQFGEGYEVAHYFRFKEILHEHFYVGGNYSNFLDENGQLPISTPPVGKKIDVDWNAAYPLIKNPKIKDYYNHPYLLGQAERFNVTYRHLLDAIQCAIEGKQEELTKSIMHMHALREIAVELMKTPFKDGLNAAPTFEYVDL